MNLVKLFRLLSTVAAPLMFASLCFGQSGFTHKVIPQGNNPPSMGQDSWFAICQNYDASNTPGKVLSLYIVPSENSNVYVQIAGGAVQTLAGVSDSVLTFKVPISWEMTSSGVVENKGIHVWADSSDLSVYFFSYNPYTTEGTAIVPSIGWGKEYVVASYQSLYEANFDYPSEFSVVASQDQTIVTINPTADIRANNSGSTVLHPKGVAFNDTLNTGQSIQYKSVSPTAGRGFDLTGTVVSANLPIGVMGADACTNIPEDYPYCDYVCEMLQPVRTWTNVYYTIPLAPRDSVRTGDTFVAIPTENGQVIYTADAVSGVQVFCTANQYQPFWSNTVTAATKWYSDAPFELVQYENSSTFTQAADGDPADVVITGVSEFRPSFIFQTPMVTKAPTPFFMNYANIVVQKSDEANVELDGHALVSYPNALRIPLADPVWEGWQVSGLAPGAHSIVGDSGIGLYMYGYGSYDSYAWSGHIGVASFSVSDSSAPIAVPINSNRFSAIVKVSDPGKSASGLASIVLGNSSNMSFAVDPKFVTGSGVMTSSYTVSVLDSTKAGSITVNAYDLAGNKTAITSTYQPQSASVATDIDPAKAWLSANDGTNAMLLPINPNPVASNSEVTLTMGLRTSGAAKITLFDILGRRQAVVLDDQNHVGGISTIHYSIDGLRTGTYYFRLEAAGETHEGKVVVE